MTLEQMIQQLDYLIDLSQEPSNKRMNPPLVPHCDCRKANERFFKLKRKSKHRHGESFEMVPCAVKKDGETCTLCSHYVYMQPLAVNFNEDRPKGLKGVARPVTGTNTLTGEQLRFRSASAAIDAGFKNILAVIDQPHRHNKGYRWVYDDGFGRQRAKAS
jgi:hypothetical protein